MEPQDKYRDLAPLFWGIAHEIRNPVQGIIANSAALGALLVGQEKLRPLLDAIQKETHRIEELLNEMLELVRPFRFELQDYSFTRILREAIRFAVGEGAQQKGSIVWRNEENHLSVRIKADAAALRGALTAVIRNGLESREGGANVFIDLQSENDRVKISIVDDGSGIDSENLLKIFEPFFSTKRKRAGLGTTIAERIIRAHNGEIRIESKVGAGTRVEMFLPVEP